MKNTTIVGKVLIIGESGFIQKDMFENYKVDTNIEILKETEKAIQVKFSYTTAWGKNDNYEEDEDGKGSREIWFPKSQAKVEDGKIIVPAWIAKEKGIESLTQHILSDGEITSRFNR